MKQLSKQAKEFLSKPDNYIYRDKIAEFEEYEEVKDDLATNEYIRDFISDSLSYKTLSGSFEKDIGDEYNYDTYSGEYEFDDDELEFSDMKYKILDAHGEKVLGVSLIAKATETFTAYGKKHSGSYYEPPYYDEEEIQVTISFPFEFELFTEDTVDNAYYYEGDVEVELD